MTVSFHEHFTALEGTVAVILELGWWSLCYFIWRRWRRRRRAKELE